MRCVGDGTKWVLVLSLLFFLSLRKTHLRHFSYIRRGAISLQNRSKRSSGGVNGVNKVLIVRSEIQSIKTNDGRLPVKRKKVFIHVVEGLTLTILRFV